jgi:hypothetical protein
MSRSKNFPVYENLDTSFVSLGALLRYLQQRDFEGRVHINLGDYEAEVRLRKGERPQVRERDTTTGREGEGEAALQRLLVRATDAGGIISVYKDEEGAGGASNQEEESAFSHHAQGEGLTEEDGRELSYDEIDWQALLRTAADLIASVERAARSTGANFDALFRTARLELADDFSFLDPNSGMFEYGNNEVELHASPTQRAFVSGLCETLRRVVERLAACKHSSSVRERVALELAVLVRRKRGQLEHFGVMPHLDRIAGTRVI